VAIAIPNEGKTHFLRSMTNETLYVKLFTNDITNNIDTLNLLTLNDVVEASGGGYTEKEIDESEWTITESEDYGFAYTGVKTWVFDNVLDNNDKIYGYYIVDSSKSSLLIVNRFAVAFYPYGAGSFYSVKPTISFNDIYTNTIENQYKAVWWWIT
jgi:hypothetical protein